jgi:hypothetical protein
MVTSPAKNIRKTLDEPPQHFVPKEILEASIGCLAMPIAVAIRMLVANPSRAMLIGM